MPNLRKSQSRKKRHVVAWIREAIGLTQSEFAHLIGASRDTIQSIELVRLTLSERFAYKIAEETGISPRWLLANKLGNPPPDPERIRQQYEDAQAGRWKGISKSHLLPRAIFFRLYAFYRAMISEVGYSGFRSAGGINQYRVSGMPLTTGAFASCCSHLPKSTVPGNGVSITN